MVKTIPMDTYQALLDKFLAVFNDRNNEELTQHIFQNIVPDYAGRLQFFDFLEKHGYIMRTPREPQDFYTITVEGALFHARGGFRADARRQKLDQWLKYGKLALMATNAVLALAVAFWAVWIQSAH